jgi:hypothetical protein
LSDSTNRSGHRRLLLAALVCGACATLVASPLLAAQGLLSKFTYDQLRVSGFEFDIGSVATHDLRGAVIGGARMDAGYLAPHVRVLLGASYTRSRFTDRAVARLNRQLLKLVTDPDSNSTIDVGRVHLSDFIADLDLQYVFNDGQPVTAVLGLGGGIHIREGSGRAINGTFIQDALSGVSPALNGTAGMEVALTPAWRITGELRGTLLSDYSQFSARVGFMYRLPAGRGRR